GHAAKRFSYELRGTPCANLVAKNLYSYSSGVRHRFPQDTMLMDIGAEGYVGSSILDSRGQCRGLLCGITTRPLENPKLAEALLQIFAVRGRRTDKKDTCGVRVRSR
ncbi:MAG: hypothetical protein ABI995_14600, partial [Acidobacteriota bacterium]